MEQNHIKFSKIKRMRTVETAGILGTPVTVQEKIDGANASVWMDKNVLTFGSRNQLVTSFNGYPEYMDDRMATHLFFKHYPNYRVFGEWLVKHTITYDETKLRKFYAFDIYDNETNEYLDPNVSYDILKDYFEVPQEFCRDTIVTEDMLEEWVGSSELGKKGEGIVIKSTTFRNKFGDKQYAKMISAGFSEVNAITFGNTSKAAMNYIEVTIMNKYMTLARVTKQIQNIESMEDRPVEMSDIPKVCGNSYHDMITEESWEIFQKFNYIDTKSLKKCCTSKARQLFVDYKDNAISIADEVKE